MKNILLINLPSNRASNGASSDMVPLALLKISTLEKSKGNHVEFINAGKIPNMVPDEILFSPVFLFNARNDIGFIKAYSKKFPKAIVRVGGVSATLRPTLFKVSERVEIHAGLDENIEKQFPDYDIARISYSYGFTSRGCINKCPWCVVPKNEGNLRLIPTWKNNLRDGHLLFKAMDNNILACPISHIEDVLREMKKRRMTVDFNQAMDCVKFSASEDLPKLFSKYPVFHYIRFAWDSHRQDGSVDKTLEYLDKYKIKPHGGHFVWYCLYGFKDDFDTIYSRIKKLISNGHRVKLMRYRDIETGLYSTAWQGIDKLLSDFVATITPNGMVSPNHLSILMDSSSDFLEMMYAAIDEKKKLGRMLDKNDRERLIKLIFERAK